MCLWKSLWWGIMFPSMSHHFLMCHFTPPNLLQMSTASPWEALRNTRFVPHRFEGLEHLQGRAVRLWCSARACWSADAWDISAVKGDIGIIIRNMKRTVLRGCFRNLSEWQFLNWGNNISIITINFQHLDLIQWSILQAQPIQAHHSIPIVVQQRLAGKTRTMMTVCNVPIQPWPA